MVLIGANCRQSRYLPLMIHHRSLPNACHNELTLFPSLDEIDIADLTYLLTMTFLGITTEDEFKRKIRELAEISDVILTDDKLDILTTIMTEFMIWLRTL